MHLHPTGHLRPLFRPADARHAQPDAGQLATAAARKQLIHEGNEALARQFRPDRVQVGRFGAQLRQDGACRVDEYANRLGAAAVDADEKMCHVRFVTGYAIDATANS